MFNFIVCDDKEVFADKIQKNIQKISKELNIEINNISTYFDPYEVLKYIKGKTDDIIDVYFLDIDFGKEINGLDVAKKIRECDAQAYIIFITSHVELSIYTFKYNLKAFDYISKMSLQSSELIKCLKNLKEDYEKMKKQYTSCKKQPSIVIKSGPKNEELLLNDIYFFESHGPKITIYTKTKQLEINNSLKNIQDSIDQNLFYRCHNSYLINLNYITSINRDLISMKNGKECVVARQKKKELEKLFTERKVVI